MQERRHMPVGIQSFTSMIEGKYVYADKTHFIPKLEELGRTNFLARPRRFGKSLFVSTLEAYFKGKKELFKGLAIEKFKAESGEEWQTYPVLKMDLNSGMYTEKKHLEDVLNVQIERWCTQFEIKSKFNIPNLDFAYIIESLYNKFGKRVVVLVDEYDKPLVATLENPELNDYYRSMLKAFYSVLKSANDYVHVSFLTGVTKFSKVSIFSDLNNLFDISFVPEYSSICGITEEELLSHFAPDIETLAVQYNKSYEEMLDILRAKYDGYRFSEKEERIYNPFSLVNVFEKKQLGDYWFASGTPSFMVKVLENHAVKIEDFEGNIPLDIREMDTYRMDYGNLPPFLFQAGYLTIKRCEDLGYGRFRLGFPNDEVKYAFLDRLMKIYTSACLGMKEPFYIGRFLESMRAGDIDDVLNLIKALMASIPYDSLPPDKVFLREYNYQTTIYLIFRLMGQYVRSEVYSHRGRSDAEVETPNAIYIFEFKVGGTPEEAIEQIKEAGYAEKYASSEKDVFLVGAVIGEGERTLCEWKIESVD